MLDYRKETIGSVLGMINKVAKAEELRINLLEGLAAVAIWHSIKDGQITPAINLLGSVKGDDGRRISGYLCKFGNVVHDSKTKELKFAKRMGLGLDKANEVFDSLPSLDEAFPPKEKVYKDVSFMSMVKSMMSRVKTTHEHGKNIIFESEDEKELFELLQEVYSKAV